MKTPRRLPSNPNWNSKGTGLAVCLSLLLHALILVGSEKWAGQHPGDKTAPRLHLRLSSTAVQNQPALPERLLVRPAHLTGSTTKPALPTSPLPPRQKLRTVPPAQTPSPDDGKRTALPSLDREDLRQQARQLRLARTETGVLRPPSAKTPPLPELIDRPVLDALARRIGQPLTTLEESTLPDGTRRIRFNGGLCLDVPRHLPYGAENPFGPTLLVPKACAD